MNGSRLSNECEESEPKELKSQDELEFGIDIVNDNGAVMYHKVSCTVHVFPVPLSQVDDGIIKELSNHHPVQVYPDPHVKKSLFFFYMYVLNMLTPSFFFLVIS